MIYESREAPPPVAPFFFFLGDFIHVATGPKVRVFTASGTYTPSAGLVAAIIECIGGGGAGGGCAATSAGQCAAAGGGGGGDYARAYVTAAQVGASQSVTVDAGGSAPTSGNNAGGNGGTSSVGSLCSAGGGTG